MFDPKKGEGKRRHFTIYNAVDVDRISELSRGADRRALRNSLGIGDNPLVGIVARLRWEKGQGVLLNAMAEIIKVIPEAILVIVGIGPDGEKLRKKAEDLKLGNHLKWAGQKSPDEIYQLYSIMDVVAVPSLFEGFGLSAAEAMAAGVPVVASRVDGLTEVVHDDLSGYLVDAGDSHNLAQALIRLLSDPVKAKEMGQEGCRRVGEKFSFERFSDSITALYDEIGRVSPLAREL